MLHLDAICMFGFMVGDNIGISLRAIFPDTPWCLKVDIEDSEALLVSEAPFEVIHERPEVAALNVHAFIVQVRDGFEVLADVREDFCFRFFAAVG